jgi:hypothetical protein
MGLIAPKFEPQPITILDDATVPDGGVNTSVIKVGMPSDEDNQPFAGVLVQFAITSSGGASDSGCDILVYRSFDGTVIDDQEIETIAIAAGDIGAANTWVQTEIFPALPADSGESTLGYAARFNLSRNGGDRTLKGTVLIRRWRFLFGV